MGNALRHTVAEPEHPVAADNGMDAPVRGVAASPVHDLHDMLTRRLAADPAAPEQLASQSRMAIVFWLALATWSAVGLAGYAIVALF